MFQLSNAVSKSSLSKSTLNRSNSWEGLHLYFSSFENEQKFYNYSSRLWHERPLLLPYSFLFIILHEFVILVHYSRFDSMIQFVRKYQHLYFKEEKSDVFIKIYIPLRKLFYFVISPFSLYSFLSFFYFSIAIL